MKVDRWWMLTFGAIWAGIGAVVSFGAARVGYGNTPALAMACYSLGGAQMAAGLVCVAIGAAFKNGKQE